MSADQFDLFEPREASSRLAASAQNKSTASAKVEPCTEHIEALRQLAARLPSEIRLGSSSWSFPGWSGLVYAHSYGEQQLARHGLPAYVTHPLMGTVGIDRTFYAPISGSDFRAYARQVAAINPAFRFLVKAPMLFTGPRLRSDAGAWSENSAFLDAPLAIAQFVLPALEGLGVHCGPLVFQFPPLGSRFTRSPARFADRLAEFLLALPKLDGGAHYAVELRDPELLTDDYLAALCAGGASHCIAIHARMPDAATQARFWRESGRSPLVIRWSLHSGLQYETAKERYRPFNALVDEDTQGRAQIAALLVECHHMSQPAWVVVNNKAEGSAPLSIERLAECLAQALEQTV